MRYYTLAEILGTDELPPRVAARIAPQGDCLAWQGYMRPPGVPMIFHRGKPVSVRSLIVEQHIERLRRIKPDVTRIRLVNTCRNPACLSMHHWGLMCDGPIQAPQEGGIDQDILARLISDEVMPEIGPLGASEELGVPVNQATWDAYIGSLTE